MGYVLLILLNLEVVDAVERLKRKAAKEYFNLICKIKKGHRPDYEFLLEEISFLDMLDELDERTKNKVLSYYLNGKFNFNSKMY